METAGTPTYADESHAAEEDVRILDLGTLRGMALSSLLGTLIVVGSYVAVPVPWLPGVPVVLQNMFVLFCALVLPWRWALATVALYLVAGGMGLPVFAMGGAGWGHFAGKTGGFLAGYLPATAVAAFVVRCLRPSWWRDALACVAGTLVLYTCGVAWLAHASHAPVMAVTLAMPPFLAADAVKMAILVPMAWEARRMLDSSPFNTSA